MVEVYNKLFNSSFAKFIFISILNTIFGLGIFYFFIYIKLPYQLASLFGTIIGVIFNYYTNKTFVFNIKNNTLYKFVFVYIFIYFFNIFNLNILKSSNINFYYGGLILIIPSGILTYILNKNFVFKKLNNKHEKN
jgi:putative flippase GtrA